MRRFYLIVVIIVLSACTSAPPPSTPTLTSTPTPTAEPPTPTPEPTLAARTTPDLPARTDTAEIVGPVAAFPGPVHYEGDLLSFEAPIGSADAFPQGGEVQLIINDEAPMEADESAFYHVLLADRLFIFRAWDTTGYAGTNTVQIVVPLDEAGTTSTTSIEVEILPADQRPQQEQQATWQTRRTDCCELLYLSGTAAARDIDQLAAVADKALITVEERLGVEASNLPVPITLIDNVWGNGGYKASEVVVSYVDRDYTSKSEMELFEMLMVHEITHWVATPLDADVPTFFIEGIAVYITGGHYKPEPIPQRTAALLESDLYIPITALADAYRAHQHEIAYIQAAGLVAYLTETYGWESFLELYQLELGINRPSQWLDEAFQEVYGLTLEEIEADFIAWLETIDPGEQTRDLILTINHFDLLRQYQRERVPYEFFPPLDYAVSQELTYRFMRQTQDPTNVAIELMLEELGNAIERGEYDRAERLYAQALTAVETGQLTRSPAADYLAATETLIGAGYRVEGLTLSTDTITAEVTRDGQITIQTLTLTRDTAGWTLTTD